MEKSFRLIYLFLMLFGLMSLTACSGNKNGGEETVKYPVPTDYVLEVLDRPFVHSPVQGGRIKVSSDDRYYAVYESESGTVTVCNRNNEIMLQDDIPLGDFEFLGNTRLVTAYHDGVKVFDIATGQSIALPITGYTEIFPVDNAHFGLFERGGAMNLVKLGQGVIKSHNFYDLQYLDCVAFEKGEYFVYGVINYQEKICRIMKLDKQLKTVFSIDLPDTEEPGGSDGGYFRYLPDRNAFLIHEMGKKRFFSMTDNIMIEGLEIFMYGYKDGIAILPRVDDEIKYALSKLEITKCVVLDSTEYSYAYAAAMRNDGSILVVKEPSGR